METYSLRMATELGKRCRLECVALPGQADGRAPSALALFRFGLLCAFRMPFRQRVEVAHIGDMALWPIGLLELLFRRAPMLILAAHGSDVSMITRGDILSRIYRAYLKLGALLLPKARVIANSRFIAGLAESAGFANVFVVPLGTDFRSLGEFERKNLLFVGRITRAKGLRFLVEEVLPLLKTDTRLRVAGTVWEDTERELLDHPSVEYLGSLNQRQLQLEYSRAEITLVPSQVAEGFGLVAIEAAACGSQIIAARAGGLLDVVRPPWGELVDPKDAIAWSRAIDACRAVDARTAHERRHAAALHVDQNFRWGNVVEGTLVHFNHGKSVER